MQVPTSIAPISSIDPQHEQICQQPPNAIDFYEAAIGTKEGRWRTRRYIMTRRLAPHFKLDPMGFSGYLFVTSELLDLAISNPKQAITSFQENRLGSVVDSSQLPLGF